MNNFIKKIDDPRLEEIINSVGVGDQSQFEKKQKIFLEYDVSFLWLLCYQSKKAVCARKYVGDIYKKNIKFLDRNFPKKTALLNYFQSRIWELFLSDILSRSGVLVEKSEKGADFILARPRQHKKQEIQIEATAPNEAIDEELKSVRPNYNNGGIFEVIGGIHELELPVVLRVKQGFDNKKDQSKYDIDKPLIIAINSCKAVGLVSDDNYVLRRILFGLGNIKINSNGQKRFEQLSFFTKPKGKENSFFVPFFRDSNYEHISGVIYTSQKPLDLICGTGFQNSGITFVPNPLANHPVDLDFPYFKKLLVGEKYQELPAKKYFKNQI